MANGKCNPGGWNRSFPRLRLIPRQMLIQRVEGDLFMDFTQILIYGGLILVFIILTVGGSMLRVSLTKKVLESTQKHKPKSTLPKFFASQICVLPFILPN